MLSCFVRTTKNGQPYVRCEIDHPEFHIAISFDNDNPLEVGEMAQFVGKPDEFNGERQFKYYAFKTLHAPRLSPDEARARLNCRRRERPAGPRKPCEGEPFVFDHTLNAYYSEARRTGRSHDRLFRAPARRAASAVRFHPRDGRRRSPRRTRAKI